MNFTQFNKNGGVEGFCLIKTVDRKMTAKGVPYLDLTLADPDGEINAKLWDYKEELHGEFAANDLIKVRGTVQPFNDSQQLRIERIRKVTEADGVRIEDFVPSAGFSGEAMFNELMKVAGDFKDEELKTLVTALLNEYKDRLLYWPAAFRLHHAIRGGLLYHTLSILRMAQGVANIYPFIDSDLLFAGVYSTISQRQRNSTSRRPALPRATRPTAILSVTSCAERWRLTDAEGSSASAKTCSCSSST